MHLTLFRYTFFYLGRPLVWYIGMVELEPASLDFPIRKEFSSTNFRIENFRAFFGSYALITPFTSQHFLSPAVCPVSTLGHNMPYTFKHCRLQNFNSVPTYFDVFRWFKWPWKVQRSIFQRALEIVTSNPLCKKSLPRVLCRHVRAIIDTFMHDNKHLKTR